MIEKIRNTVMFWTDTGALKQYILKECFEDLNGECSLEEIEKEIDLMLEEDILTSSK